MSRAHPRPRRIVHVLPWPTVGGTEIATLRIIQALARDEFTHLALCAQAASEADRFFSGAGVQTLPYAMPELSLRRPLPFLRSSLVFARALRRSGAELIHCADVMSGIHATLAARVAGLPVICHVRSPHADLPGRYRRLLGAVTRLVFVSGHARNHFPVHLGERRSVVIYDGVAAVELSHPECRAAIGEELHIPARSKLVGMVARVAPQKDHKTFLSAARRVLEVNPSTHFLVIGDYAGTPTGIQIHTDLCRQAGELGIARQLTFTGFRGDVARYLAAMDVVVLATHVEGLPLTLLEAMAQGRPVVATAVGGIPEVISDGETGLLHGHEDAGHLASQVLSLLRSERRAVELGESGKRLVKTRFSMERFATSIADLYRAVLDGRPGPALDRSDRIRCW